MTGFFECLFERKCNENDLSDIVYALIKSDPCFKKNFLDFFGVTYLHPHNIKIEREKSLGDDSRIDFIIETEENILFLENKIDDKDYHFEKYDKAIASQSDREKNIIKSLISVHKLSYNDSSHARINGWDVYSWTDFLSKIPWECSGFIDISRQFKNYLKLICRIKEVGRMTFDENTISIIYFITTIGDSIEKQQGYKLMGKNDIINSKYNNIGLYYRMEEQCIDVWYGMLMEDENPAVAITVGQNYFSDQSWFMNIVKNNPDLIENSDSDPLIKEIKKVDSFEEIQIILKDFPIKFNRLSKEEQQNRLQLFFDSANQKLLDILKYENTKKR